MMKLVIAVVQNEDADSVVDALLEDEFRATRLALKFCLLFSYLGIIFYFSPVCVRERASKCMCAASRAE